ncbi:uncharacterized protein [Paramisgurnus dabryanus]|uniref:uncharacterized protein n=1 Tax=Paramisgurnus dabryanus TaxID=90735 RepID=UPI0031F3C563
MAHSQTFRDEDDSSRVRLSGCNIPDEGCVALTLALKSNPSHLRELDLTDYNLTDSGVKLISDVLKNPDCKLEILKLWSCDITDEDCVALISALRSNPSHLRQVDLSYNKIRDSGVKVISDVLKKPDCKLKILWLCDCDITDEGCVALTSALGSNPSHLRDLDLSDNNLTDSGVKLISNVLRKPDCKLEILKTEISVMEIPKAPAEHGPSSALTQPPSPGLPPTQHQLFSCGITDEGCVALTSALRLNPSHLRYLNLSYNKLRDIGVKLISGVLQKSECKLETLWLRSCDITDKVCVDLTSALSSNPSHLKFLDLSYNKLTDSGEKMISKLRDDPCYKLQTAWPYRRQ